MYSHRNGETRPPIMEGWYWTTGMEGEDPHIVWVQADPWGRLFTFILGMSSVRTERMNTMRWYGPLVLNDNGWQPVDPIHMANDAYGDAEIKLCYHRKPTTQSTGLRALDTEREIIEAMADDWLERFQPGSPSWADAQVIRSWLNRYKGTPYHDKGEGENEST